MGGTRVELVDRYVSAVKTYLPADQQDDIGKELSANIQAEMDDREEELGRPLTPTDLGWRGDSVMLVPSNADLAVPWTAAGSLRAVRTIAQAGPMDRRALLLLMGTAATAPAHDWLIARAVDDLDRSDGAPLPAEIVDDVDDITARLRRMDDRLGGGSLLALVGEQLRYVTSLIENRRYREAVGRRLHGSAAELLRLGGWLAFDSGRHGLAQRHWIGALHAAHAAGDRAIGANILGFMSCQAKDLGQVQEAITLAETARAGYPGASPQVTAILHLRAAEAYANDHANTACRRAIDEAFEALSDSPGSTGSPDWCYWLDQAHAHGQAGYCFIRLGDWGHARNHLRAAIRMQSSETARESALRQVLLATTYIRQDQPDLDGALSHANSAVDVLDGEVDSARCLGHVSRLLECLAPYKRRPAVRDFFGRCAPILAASA